MGLDSVVYSLVGQICLEHLLYSGLMPGSWRTGCWGSREERECYRWTGGWGGNVAQRPKDPAPELNVAGRVRVWSEKKGPRTEGAGCRHVSSVAKYTKHTTYHFKVYNSAIFHSFTVLRKHYLYQIPKPFHHAKKKPPPR